MSIRSTIGGAIARVGARIASKSSPPLPSFGGGYGVEWQWSELARELSRLFQADRSVDYSQIDPMMNSIVGMCMNTITSASTDSRLRVAVKADTGAVEDPEHRLAALFLRPNDDLAIEDLLAATRVDLNRGNAYWWKERDRDGTGDVVGLWLLPRQFVRARWPMDGSEFISFYEMWTGRGWQRLEKRDVVHFRRGLDTTPGLDGRYGIDPLKTALREVAIDERAGDWAAVVLENHGAVSAIITPKDNVNLSPEQVKERVAAFQKAYTGPNRGKLMLATLALDVQKLGLDPKTMDFGQLHDRAESRICGLLNVPAALVGAKVGISAGMAKANSEEDTKRLWTLSILPTETIIAGRAARDLLPEFDETSPDHFVDFDHSRVEALRANLKELAEIAETLFSSSIVSRRRAQAIAQQDVDEATPDVYFVPGSGQLVPVGELPPMLTPASLDASPDAADLAGRVRALPARERRLLKAAVDAAADRADSAAEAYWREHASPALRGLLGAGDAA